MRPLSDAAREQRTAMRLMLAVAVVALGGALAGLRGAVPAAVGLVCGVALLVAAPLAALFGFQAHRRLQEDDERQQRLQSILLVAAQLATQDDAALEAMAARRGLAADAARLILQGRAERRGGRAAEGTAERAAERAAER